MNTRKNLCLTCTRATIITYERELGPAEIHCGMIKQSMKREVYECSMHAEQNEMDVSDYNQIAWIIDPGKGGKIGFLRPGTPMHKKLKSTTPGDTW